jgi:hypothetical protein
MQAGSVLVVEADITEAGKLEKLLELERNGIGKPEYTKDGFGAVRAASRSHIDQALPKEYRKRR